MVDHAPEDFGYRSPRYGQSLSEFGEPILLARSRGQLLLRTIPGADSRDSIACYPFLTCVDWTGLGEDLRSLDGDLVSVTAVTDPFANLSEDLLRDAFKDRVVPYKQHHVARLGGPPGDLVSAHHMRNLRKAQREVRVEVSTQPHEHLAAWTALYQNLAQRHGIEGIARFSPASFAIQMGIPGILAFVARCRSEIVGMTLWFQQGRVAYYHLGAYSDLGYSARASFPLFWTALEYFTEEGAEFLSLGAGAGVQSGATSGLARFKQGWCNETRLTYLCGRILDPAQYSILSSRVSGAKASDFFPAYRAGQAP